MCFPDNCIRGIKSGAFLTDDGRVGASLFFFEERYTRVDGWTEQSINWEDDDHAIEFTLNQRKETGEKQFKAGVVVIPRNGIDRVRKLPGVIDKLSYERQRLDDNPYHGNMLLQANVRKPTMKLIGAALALAVSRIIPQQAD